MFKCTNCGREQPANFLGYKCPVCGGLLRLAQSLVYEGSRVDPSATGVWRYRHTFPFEADIEPVSLGEGNTPLLPVQIGPRTIQFKHEGLNPTGSFKDRGMAVVLAWLKANGVREAIEDSSGNAGASFAGYAARAGLGARVFVPAGAAGAKRRQIEAYGAQLVAVDGPRSAASAAALAEADSGAVYASHVYNPLGLAGNATCAYEIVAQLGRAPEAVLLPVGHGTLLLGLHLGFKALHEAGVIAQLPRLHAVQALACAPLWAVSQYGRAGLDWIGEGTTLAEGIRVLHPLRGDFVLNAIRETGGSVLAVDDPEIYAGHTALARLGLYVEPTCAAVWPVLDQVPGDLVVVLTGSGLKTPLDLAPPAPRELPAQGRIRRFGD